MSLPASLMTQAVKGKSLAEAHALFERFRAMVTAPVSEPVDTDAHGKLAEVKRLADRIREIGARARVDDVTSQEPLAA